MSPDFQAEVLRHWGGQPDGAHDLGHLRRVWANCRLIAMDEPGADLQILQAAAWLHDLINLPKSAPDRATASSLSAEAAARYLATTDFPGPKIPSVAHAIAAHSFSAGIPATTLDARILQDADRLEALGAIGLARMFYVAGSMGAQLFDADDPLARRRPLDDKQFSLDHLEVKLFKLPGLMHTKTGRAMAESRVEWMQSFRSLLLREIQ